MNKIIGNVYTTGRTYVLCTGYGKSDNVFSGIVVKQEDETSEHQIGVYSSTWTEGVFKEAKDDVVVDNSTWRSRYEIEISQGNKVI